MASVVTYPGIEYVVHGITSKENVAYDSHYLPDEWIGP